MGHSVKWIAGTCFITWLYIYGFLLLCFDTLISSFPPTILGSVILFIAYHYVKLPPPDSAQVERLLGPDPWLEEENGSSKLRNSGKDESSNDSDMNGTEVLRNMKVIAHRGAGLDAPENSIASFRKCKERGCSAVEFDVSLTSDGIPVIFHDRIVDRVTDGTGELSSMTFSEARKLDISHKHAFREWYKGEHIPTLEEAVGECLALGLTMFIDIKENDVRTVPHILGLFGVETKSGAGDASGIASSTANVWIPPPGTDMHSKAIVTSFHPHLIYLIRRADPRIVCTLAWRPFSFSSESYSASAALGPSGINGCIRRVYPGMFTNLGARIVDEVIGWCFQRGIPYNLLGLSGLLIHKDVLSPEMLRQWRAKGVRIIAWTVNNPTEKQYFSKILKLVYITDTLDAESNHIPNGLDLAATR